MTCGCEKEKPKGAGKSFTKAVVEINNPSKITLLRKIVIPASLGDETTIPPVVGKYCNVVLYYEASKAVYLYSSDGIPTLLTADVAEIEKVIEELQGDLAQEIEDRENADDELDDKIDKVISDLEDEVAAREDTDEELQGLISTNTTDIAGLRNDLSDEISNRQYADISLQSQIDAISASSDVRDIVGTYSELENYDTSTLGNNDIIKVLQDETQDGSTTYYRWNTSTQTFTLIGGEGPYYTKSQADLLLSEKQDNLTAGPNIDITNNVISATDTTYSAGNGLALTGTTFSADTSVLQSKLTAGNNISISGNTISATDTTYTAGAGLDLAGTEFSIDNTVALKTDLPIVNNAIFTIQKNGSDVAAFTANSAVDVTANITVPTNNNELTNGAGYQTAADVASAISGKQDILTPGSNIQISNNTISATDTTYSAGNGLNLTGTIFSADTSVLQTKLTAGNNIDITNGVISSDGPTYTAGTGLDLTNNEFAVDTSVVALKSDIPTVSTATLKIQKNGTDVATFTTNDPTPVTANITVPTNNNELTNGAGYQTAADVQTAISGKQDILTPGTNIQINGNTISATDTKYSAGNGLTLTGTVFYADTSVLATQTDLASKQDVLTPGPNITISGNTISATDTTYSDFIGANLSTAGTHGLVPAPAAGDNTKFLAGDGTWKTVSLYELPIASSSTLGGVKIGSGLTIDSNGVLSSTGLQSVDWSDVTNKPNFATVATTGDYDDLINTPVLATVATSGSYNDLSNKPTIPAAQVNSNWNATSGVAQILNKPSLATVATSGSYDDLTNKPTIPTIPTRVFYGTSSTAAATAAKVVTCADFTADDLVAGTRIVVYFTNANSYNGTATLDINNTGAKDIYYNGSTTNSRYMWVAGESVDFVYNGTQWATVNGGIATTTYYGVTKLYTGAGSTSTSLALTPNSLYALANGSIAPYYSTSSTYAVGDKVRYGNLLYECNTAITTAESWTAAHWTQLDPLQEQLDDLEDSLATVATSGSYNDLTNKPTIPAAQVNSDWNANSGVAQILNKPSLATVATSGSYTDLSNKPTIPTVNNATLTVTQNGVSAGTFTANASSNTTIALTDTTYSNFTGTNGNTGGSAGLVPAPAATDANKYLKSDGTWATVQGGSSYTAGDNIDITNNVIDTAITVPLIGTTLSTPSSTVFVNTANIANGAVTSDKLAISSIIDIFYPVGSYYETSDTAFNPNTAWGGTWVEDSAGLVTVAKDTGTFATVGDTGGEETHTLTTAEIPSHSHTGKGWAAVTDGSGPYNVLGANGTSTTYSVNATGGGAAHNILQPYVVVKRWHRTA